MRTVVAILLLGMLRWTPAAAAPSVEQLLERAFLNPRSTAHQGTLRVEVAAVPGPPSNVRLSCDGKGRERREHTEGPARDLVVLTDGRTLWQRRAGESLWQSTPCPPSGAGSWERLRRNYEFRAQGSENIAGRKAVGVALVPRHAGNPRQVVWLDPATALILRTESFTHAGALAARSTYVSLTLRRPAEGALIMPGEEEAVPAMGMGGALSLCASLREMESRLGYRVALPARLPPGYVAVAYYVRACRREGRLPVVRYEDGLNALTLFLTPGRGRGRRYRGGRSECVFDQVAGQEVARTAFGRFTYTLVGDHDPRGLSAALESTQ